MEPELTQEQIAAREEAAKIDALEAAETLAVNTKIVVDGLKAGHSKMVILTDLVRNDATLDLGAAGALYKKVGTDNNLLLNKDAKDTLVTTVAAQFTAEGKLDREKAVAALIEQGAMTKNSAVNRLKGHCAEHKIEFPVASRTSRDMDAVNNAYSEWSKEGTSRESIQAGLVKHFGYTEKSVSQAYLKIGKALGLISAEASVGRTELAAWFTNAENVKGEKKVIVAKLMKDTTIAKATAESRYAMYLFALEYVKACNPVADTEETQEAA